MAIRLATAPVSWGVTETGWNYSKSYSVILDEIAKAGFEGTELGPYGFYPSDPERLSAELSSRGLKLVSAFVPIRLNDPRDHPAGLEAVMKVGRLLSKLSCKLIVLSDALDTQRIAIAGRVFREDGYGLTETQWSNVARACSEIATRCRDMGLHLVFHHHVGSFIESPQEVQRLCEVTDPDDIGLCLDTGHYIYGGGEPVDAFDRYGSRIRHVHFKDINPYVLEKIRREKLDFLDGVREGVFCSLGEGSVDFKTVVERMKKIHYDGWIVFEQDIDPVTGIGTDGQKPFWNAVSSHRYLEGILAA